MTKNQPTFHIVMLATPQTDHYSGPPIRLWKSYARQHGYSFSVCRDRLINDLHINWSKIELVRKSLNQRSEDFLLLVDADTLVVSPSVPLGDLIKNNNQIMFASDTPFPRLSPDFRHLALRLRLRRARLPNAGFMLIKNTGFSQKFFTDWLQLARGKLAAYADIHPRNQNVLWRGLLNQHRTEIGIYKKEILRMTVPGQIARLKDHNPFAVHFSHENIDVNSLIKHLNLKQDQP